MNFNADFNFVRTQKLLLIPQLKQALDILGMNLQELSEYIEEQLVSNPALEKAQDYEFEGLTDEKPDYVWDDPDIATREEPEETLSLKEHLLNQLNAMGLDKCGYKIGEYLIDGTDDNGFITVGTGEVASFFNVPEEKVLSVLGGLQALEPPGICARNLRECLLLQLRQLDEKDEDAILVVKDFLDELASDDAESVAFVTGLPVERVRDAFGRIKSLEPRPGREFFRHEAQRPAAPDIIVSETGESLRVLYNDEAVPEICVSDSFTNKLSGLDERETVNYMHEKVKNAVWFIKCLEQRKNILTSIAQKLCAVERNFFRTGSKAIKVISRPQFAALLDMHETILDKAIEGKLLQCRWGVFELGAFFTGHEKTEGEITFI